MKLREKTRSVRPLDSAGRPQPISTLPTGGRSAHSRLVRIYGASINWFMRTSTFLLIPVDSAENEFLSAHPIPHPAGRPCRGSGAGLSAGKPSLAGHVHVAAIRHPPGMATAGHRCWSYVHRQAVHISPARRIHIPPHPPAPPRLESIPKVLAHSPRAAVPSRHHAPAADVCGNEPRSADRKRPRLRRRQVGIGIRRQVGRQI